MGDGTSASRLVASAIMELEMRGVRHVTTPMCTIIEEDDLGRALQHVAAAHEAVITLRREEGGDDDQDR